MTLAAARARALTAAPLALAVLAAGCVVMAIGPWPVGVFQDDGIYAVLAKSLASGQGYRFLQIPGAPNAAHYPPGYPLLLAALWKLYPSFPQNVTLFKFANAVLLGVAAYAAWHLASQRARLGPLGSALATGLFTACTPVVLLSVMVLSEPLFMALLLPTLLLSERAADSGQARHAAAAGVAGGVLAMVRTLGVFTIPATALVLAWRRQWRAACVVVAAGALTMLPWQLWVTAHAHEVPAIFLGKYGSYTGWLSQAVRDEGPQWVLRVAQFNIGKLAFETWTHTGTVLLPLGVRVAATVAVIALFVTGLAVAMRRIRVTAVFVIAYLGVVVAWPFAPARFVWGIFPLVGIVLALGAQAMVARRAGAGAPRSAHAWRLAPALGVALVVVGYLKFNYQSIAEGWWTQVQGGVAMRARPMAQWVNASTRPDAVLATDDDLLIYLYTGRHTIPNAAFTAQEHLVAQRPAFAAANLRTILKTYRVDYVLATTEYSTYAVNGLVAASPPGLRLVSGLSSGGVFAPLPGALK